MVLVVVEEREHIDLALRRFRRAVREAGIPEELRKRRYAMKPSVKKKYKAIQNRNRKHAAIKRARKNRFP